MELTLADGGRPWTLKSTPEELEKAIAGARNAGATVAQRVAVRGLFEVPAYTPSPAAPSSQAPAPFGERDVRGSRARLYDWDRLPAGSVLTGPVVLESGTNTCSVPAGWEVTVDGFDNGVIRRANGGA